MKLIALIVASWSTSAGEGGLMSLKPKTSDCDELLAM